MGAPPRRGLFPGLRHRLREMLPGSAQQSPVQPAGANQPGPSSEAVSVTVSDE